METRSRKRAEASSSSSTTRAARRLRLSAVPAAPSVCTRSRAAAAAAAAAAEASPMETAGATESSSSRGGRRRGQSGKSAQQAEVDGHGGNEGGGGGGGSGKGKEKEVEVKGREIGFDGSGSGAGAGDDDDSEGGGGVGLLHQNLSSASSALQGLLRKLGAGLDDLLPSSGLVTASSSHQNGRLKKILSGLRADGEGRQVEALTQLCEMLSICTEESLATFSVDSFVPVLVGLLNHESNPDIMLLAARAITHLCDVLPSSCSAVVHYGAVPCFCARLLTIEYMDLAEQSLQALKKISQEHPTACLRAGALMAVLSYLDFFSTGIQRVALSTAANMCKKLPSDASDFVMDAIPLLTNLLQYHDAKVLEHASVCLTRISEAFASSSEKLDALCNHGLVAQAASLISISNAGGGQALLSTSTYTGLIRLLSTCASGSALAAKTLLLLGISSILKDILSGSGQVSSVSTSPALTRPPEQIFEIVNLADELLLPLPQGVISLPTSSFLVKGSSATKKSVTVSDKKEDSEGIFEMSAREKLLRDQPELLQQFGLDLLPVLIQIYGSSVNSPVRHKCLSVIGKLMYFSTADMIESLLGITNVASFLAGVLAWKDPQVLIPALQIAKILMEKLPGTFSKMFVREGVVHAVEMLISADSSPASQSGTTEKEKETSQGTLRTRRGRRRSGSQTVDVASTEDSKASAAGASSTHPSSVETPVSSNHRATVSTHAKAFKDKYFPADPGSSELFITDDLLRLKNLCARLNAGADNTKTKGKGKSKATTSHLPEMSSCNEGHLIEVISELLSELSKDDGVSTFEFIGSGVVLALLNYLSCGTFAKEIPEADMLKFRQQAIKRFKSFVSVALPAGIHETNNQAPMSLLVSKLQNALSSLERFPVVLSHPSRSSTGTARLSSGLSALAQPFKLRLCRAQGDKSLRDYSSNIVLIDPLASLAAIEAFLWHRVNRGESGQKPVSPTTVETTTAPSEAVASPPTSAHASSGHRPSTRSRSSMSIGVGNNSGDGSKKDSDEGQSNLLKGKGKAVMKPSDDAKGPQTRTATRRKAALEKDAHMKSVDTDISSEDEDLDDSHLDIDDELVIEEEDISEDDDDQEEILEDSITVSMLDKVHDVKLSDAAEVGATVSGSADSQTNTSGTNETGNSIRGADSSEYRSRAPFGSRGALTFAAAAMAGLTSVNSRGIRGSRDRHGLLIGSSNDPPRLVFSAGGKQLSRNLTIYQAVQRQLVLDEDEDERYTSSDFLSSDGSRMWSDVYTITYQKADSQVDHGPSSGSASSSVSKSGKSGPASSSSTNTSWKQTSLLDSILQGNLPCDVEKSNPTYNILALLRVLNGLNQLAPRLRVLAASDDFAKGRISNFDDLSTGGAMVPCDEFINSKLTPKLARQIQDALALCSGSLPSWCYQLTKSCPFLFSFETRKQFFNSTAFGLSRALHRLGQQQGLENQGSAGDREVRVGRLQRQKVRVSRNRILESAAKVMEMYSSQKAVLEVEYFGEVGTGLGPTLEFYTLVSHELQKVSLGMWRSSPSFDKSSMDVDMDEQKDKNVDSDAKKLGFVETGVMAGIDYVHAPLGLFPRPWPPSADNSEGSQYSKVIDYFRLIGRVMAKALQDGRLLDLPLSPAFYKLLLGQELDLQDIFSIDAEFGKTLQELQVIVHRKQHIESVGATDLIVDLHFRGSPIEDLCLDFTLPGYPDYVLKPGEENVTIDINNLEEYVSLVVDSTVRTGIMRQMDAFRAGFNQVFDITSLQIFSPYELDYLLCGRRELWKAETLVDHLKFDHGYTAKSPAIINLLEIMGQFTPDQQRAFCQFVTGAPQLPPGGLAVLNPKLTIVRKHTSSVANIASNGGGLSESADDDLLPSVMTCANYLKLPSYSTKEIMYKKLLYAIREGQGSFDLS